MFRKDEQPAPAIFQFTELGLRQAIAKRGEFGIRGVIADAAVLAGDDTRTFCHGFTRMTTDKTEQMKRPRPNAVAFFDSQLTR